jgi:hypothetical protein
MFHCQFILRKKYYSGIDFAKVMKNPVFLSIFAKNIAKVTITK